MSDDREKRNDMDSVDSRDSSSTHDLHVGPLAAEVTAERAAPTGREAAGGQTSGVGNSIATARLEEARWWNARLLAASKCSNETWDRIDELEAAIAANESSLVGPEKGREAVAPPDARRGYLAGQAKGGNVSVRSCLEITMQTIDEWKEDADGRVHVHKDVIRRAVEAAIVRAREGVPAVDSAKVPVNMLRKFTDEAKQLYFASNEHQIEACLRRAWEEGYGHGLRPA
jgi:hypothetical protein